MLSFHHRDEHIETLHKRLAVLIKAAASNYAAVICTHTGSSVISLLRAYQRRSLLHKEPGALARRRDVDK